MSGPEWWSPRESEVSQLLRQTDWSGTPFGPRAAWPKVLLNAVQLLIDTPTSAILFWGRDKLQIYNDGYIEIMGPRHPKYFGAPYRECWPDTYPHINPWMERVMETGEVLKIEKALFAVTRHGFYEEAFFTFTFSPLRDDDGVIRGIFQPCIEVTGTVLAERRAETLRALSTRLDAADLSKDLIDALVENPHDVPFALIFSWRAAEQRLEPLAATPNIAACPGLTAELERAARQVVHGDAPLLIEDLSGALAGQHIGPWQAPAKSALVLPMRRTDAAVPRGVVVLGISSALGLDDRYRGFLELAAGQITSAIEGANALKEARERAQALAELDRAKTAFFSNVSHEFRTPLTLMLGPTEDALQAAEPRLQGQQLEMLYRNELRLLKLVNTLLDFSRVEAGSIQTEFALTDLAKLTRDFSAAFRPAIERAGLVFEVNCEPLPALVWVDQAMWEKIVMNLLSNALKFTFEGSIGLSLTEQGEEIELLVRDTGTGIPESELPRLFKRFHRVSQARSRTHEGSGIGLALVQELCKLHGGGVSVTSTVDRGTTFTVRLPLRHDTQSDAAQATLTPATSLGVGAYIEEAARWSPHARDGARRLPNAASSDPSSRESPLRASTSDVRILVADDNADMREYLSSLLSPRFAVECVSDGRAALETIRRSPPDLLICDVMMPNLDGFGLLRELRGDPRTAALPIIMLSARAGEEAAVEGIERGADDYLVKPFSARELFARVAARLEIHRLNQELERKVQARTAELSETNRELESFSYSVSHDLRAPLRHIVGFAQLLERGSSERLDDKAKGQLTVIKEAAERGGQLVDDLLAFSRLGRAEVAKRRVDLGRLVVDVRDELASEMGDSHVSWDVGDLPPVEADAPLLRLVVKNLLSNAIKYSRPRPAAPAPAQRAHIQVRAEEHVKEVEVWVKDDGVGFDMAYVDNLFGVFQRLHSSREFEGTGIGLAHVRRIVLKHGGRTWAEGELGKGATFHFTLPRGPQPRSS